jgi:hypothetical protein
MLIVEASEVALGRPDLLVEVADQEQSVTPPTERLLRATRYPSATDHTERPNVAAYRRPLVGT